MAEEEKKEMSQPVETTRVIDGVTEHLRGGVWYKERKVAEKKVRRITIDNSSGGGPRFKREFVRK